MSIFYGGFARGCRMATLVTVCLIIATVNEAEAATRTDLGPAPRASVRVPGLTVFATGSDDSQAYPVVNMRESAAVQAAAAEPARPLVALPFALASDPIEGIASTYDPGDRADIHAGGADTASGERYDPEGWSAAIRIDLRDKFGFTKGSCQSTYALVESADKRLIVKINDVGTLRPGRIIDLNVRAMRYFDPSMALGLIKNIKVTPLVGNDMPPGPVEKDPPRNFAGWFV
jgi:rare lipoprotein A